MVLGEHRSRDATGGVPPEMGDFRAGNIDVEPPGATQPVAEVDVLEVHEIAGVEPADGFECGPA
jgi:hypothetical protein